MIVEDLPTESSGVVASPREAEDTAERASFSVAAAVGFFLVFLLSVFLLSVFTAK